jgi:diadenosine tetraphosphate (Ap4A) HIT family hydrolase
VAADCLVCRELSGEVRVPGGMLVDEEHALAFHVPPLPGRGDPYLGHLLVVTRRHVAGLPDLSAPEGAAVGRIAAALARALVAAGGATRVHAAVAGLDVPHFHQHLLPRYADTPAGTSWHSLDEWEGARRGGPAEIEALAERLRAASQ